MSTKTTRFLGIDWRVATDHRADTIAFVAYWVFASGIILSSFGPNVQPLHVLGYYAYMVVGYTLSAWLVVNLIFPTFFPKKQYAPAMVSILVVLTICAYGSHALEEWIEGRNYAIWNSIFNFKLPNDSQNVLTLAAILFGRKYVSEQQRTIKLESERRQAELQRLRAQVDPHFLFNSLNILDILIEDDPTTAKAFVHRLSNMYRYLIRHRDEDLVPAADELQHARDYNFLVEQRFGGAFHFRENFEACSLEKAYLPPGSLQTVLENVYKHNLATERNPVTITIECREGALFVINDHSPKPGELATHERSGSGTANLFRRYSLLTDEETYSRPQGAHWMARLPLLYLEEGSSSTTSLQVEKV